MTFACSRRYRRSTSTYVADENGQRVVIMTSSSPGFPSGLSSTNVGPNNFGPIRGIGSNQPFGSTSNLGSASGGSTLDNLGGTLGSGGKTLGGSIGVGNTGFKKYGNRDGGISKYPSARLIIEVLRLLGVPNLPLPPLPSFPISGGGTGGGYSGGEEPPESGFNEALACSLLGRCVNDMEE